jgi:hypothetical protein
MTITVRPPAAKRVPMDSMRKTALAAGGFYLITIITSIAALALYSPVLNNPDSSLAPAPTPNTTDLL